MAILVTGAAGFIGFHLSKALLAQGKQVIGIDNLNAYYDPMLKQARLDLLEAEDGFTFKKLDFSDAEAVKALLKDDKDIDIIVHLGAQAGVRYSLDNPLAYGQSNLIGHLNMLEAARTLQEAGQLKHFIYASSSSVYGGNTKQPFSENDPIDRPVSLYSATKISCEMMTQSYSHIFKIPSTGLRFFTVYGPYGRPDMAYFEFTRAILAGEPIAVFNHGKMKRDFTWINDIVSGLVRAIDAVPDSDAPYTKQGAPHRIFNLGNHRAENLLDFIAEIEKALGKEAKKNFVAMAPGDVEETYADISAAKDILEFAPKTPISTGIPKFIEWYREYYAV